MANPTGWDSSWGTYQAGVNDFSTVKAAAAASGDTALASQVEAARNNYIDSQGGSVTTNGGTYTKTYDYTTSVPSTSNNSSSNSSSSSTNSSTKSSSAGNDYSGVTKYDTTKLPSSVDYGGNQTLSYNSKYGGQSNVTSAQLEKYGATTDYNANSNLWWQVQNDQTLNSSQKAYLQAMLHEANEQLLSSSSNYDSHTGTWTDKSTGEQVNIVTDTDKNSYVADPNKNASTISYTYKDGKYYYNGKEIQQVEFRTASGSHVGLAYIIDGDIYIQQGNNWTAAPVSSLTNSTGEQYAIYDGTNVTLIPNSAWASYTAKEEEEEEEDEEEEENEEENETKSSSKTVYSDGTSSGTSGTVSTDDLANMTEEEVIKYIEDQLLENGATDLDVEDFLSWAESYALAQSQLSPTANSNLQSALDDIDTAALKSGFYGQLPTEALKQQAAAEVEEAYNSDVANLAWSIYGQSRDDAIEALEAAIDEGNFKMNSLLNLVNLLGTYNRDGTTKSVQTTSDDEDEDTSSSNKSSSSDDTIYYDDDDDDDSTTSVTPLTSLQYSEDEGTFYWNGKYYGNYTELKSDINSNSSLTSAQKATLISRINNQIGTTSTNTNTNTTKDTTNYASENTTNEKSSTYNDIVNDIITLKKNGENDQTINSVISSALNSGIITSTQAQILRSTYIGSR